MNHSRIAHSTAGGLNFFVIVSKVSSAAWSSARGALAVAVLSALLLMTAHPAQSQTETVLYSFTGGSDGGSPNSRLTADGAGNLYGTTVVGGLGFGTVFELSPNASGGWNETVLYSFTGGDDGAYPTFSYVMFDNAGNLYGTAYQDGMNGNGVVFELSRTGGTWNESVLYTFAGGADGGNPVNGLIMDQAGNLYGTTLYGGATGNGTVFKMSLTKSGWTEQVIYNRQVATAGYAGLAMNSAGDIFGAGLTKIFELSPKRDGGWASTVIYTFDQNGYEAQGTPVLDQAGNIYGTTLEGGLKDLGTVYKLSRGKNGLWSHLTLYYFPVYPNGLTPKGAEPWGTVVMDANGNLYGTTIFGGSGGSGAGTAFELLAPSGKGGYKEKVLWNFGSLFGDGNRPYANLILDGAGNLYGTTLSGGSSGFGTVFRVTP